MRDRLARNRRKARSGQRAQVLVNGGRYVGERFPAVAGGESVQHPVVGPDVDHRCPGRISQGEGAVRAALYGVGVRHRGSRNVARRRVNDVSELARRPAAERWRAAAAGRGFIRRIAAQPLHPLRTEAVGAGCDSEAEDLDFGRTRPAVRCPGDVDAHAIGRIGRKIYRAFDQIVAGDRGQRDPAAAVPALHGKVAQAIVIERHGVGRLGRRPVDILHRVHDCLRNALLAVEIDLQPIREGIAATRTVPAATAAPADASAVAVDDCARPVRRIVVTRCAGRGAIARQCNIGQSAADYGGGSVEQGRLCQIHLGGRRRSRIACGPAKRDSASAKRCRRLVRQDGASRIPVLAVDDLTGIPLLRSDRAVLIDQVGDQLPGPVAAVEARLVQIGAGAPRAGVERDRRRCGGLGLDVDSDRLKGGGERCRVLRQIGGTGATQGRVLIHGRDRAGIGHRVAHADDVGLDIVWKPADRDTTQRADLSENVVRGRGKSPRPPAIGILLLV